jgi:CheY-like chemotaxis protein
MAAILLVDDEPLLRAVLRRHLVSEGHRIAETGGAEEALALISGGARYDLILCDMIMPGANGIDLHRELAARFADQARRVVFMTGGTAMDAVQEFLAGLPNPWLEKPFTPEGLSEIVDRQLRDLGAAPR